MNLVDDNEYNPDEDFGDNEVNATKSRKFVSAREYYCFKLQVRKKLFNIILFGGRLFQQWAVDMYIKIETMRLDWYSKPANQKVIRTDLYQVTCFYLSQNLHYRCLTLCLNLYTNWSEILFYYRVLLTPSLLASHAVIGLARESCFHVHFLVVTVTCSAGFWMRWQ